MKYSIIHPHKYLLTILGVCKLVVVCTNTEGLVPSIGCCQVLFLLSFSKLIAQNITAAFIPQAPRNVLSNVVFAADLESCLALLYQYSKQVPKFQVLYSKQSAGCSVTYQGPTETADCRREDSIPAGLLYVLNSILDVIQKHPVLTRKPWCQCCCWNVASNEHQFILGNVRIIMYSELVFTNLLKILVCG